MVLPCNLSTKVAQASSFHQHRTSNGEWRTKRISNIQ